jgi:hypothetical protein
MSAIDRTDDLIRAMLERRADAPMPSWLAAQVRETLAGEPQVRGRRATRWQAPLRRGGRLSLAAAVVAILVVASIGVLLAANIIDLGPTPKPTLPAIVVGPSESPEVSPSHEAPPSPAESTVAPGPTPGPAKLAWDTIAVVTKAGDGLRVRTAPGVGADSKKLEPLLPSGARMLVVDGPVAADGYDWYEVRVEDGLFGWVAAGKQDEAWIRGTEPKCTDDLDVNATWIVARIDYLVCYGDTAVRLFGRPDDPELDTNGRAHPAWLFQPIGFLIPGATGDAGSLAAFAQGSARSVVLGAPEGASLDISVALDDPEARNCRVLDRNGRDVIPREQAITECRLRFTIREAKLAPAGYSHALNTQAVVDAAALPIRTSPGSSEGFLASTLQRGDRVYVDDGPRPVDGIDWYRILDTGTGTAYGWVPALVDGGPSMLPRDVDCPSMTDWVAFMRLSPTERLTCYNRSTQKLDVWVANRELHQPYASMGCAAYALGPTVEPSVECRATPGWRAELSGPTIWRVDGVDLGVTFDPDRVSEGAFPLEPTRMRVTGKFSYPYSWDCRVTDAATDELLLRAEVADIYCRSTFVVTALSSPAPER